MHLLEGKILKIKEQKEIVLVFEMHLYDFWASVVCYYL